MARLPAEVFARRGVWVIVKLPLSEKEGVAIERLYIIKGQYTFLPLFTSELAARDHAVKAFGASAAGFAPVTFDGIRKLGTFLDALTTQGIQYVTFDSDPAGGSPSFAIGDVADALRDHLARFSDN